MKKTHIVRSFDAELEELRSKISELGKASGWQIAKAVNALSNLDSRLAEETVKCDKQVNELFAEIEDLVVAILYKRQPLASDLRYIIASLRIGTNLERVADYGANIAKYALKITSAPKQEITDAIREMTKWARQMLDDVIDGYLSSNVEKVIEVWHTDDEIDNLYARTISQLRREMEERGESIENGTTLLSIAKCCERIGDHLTNVAENVHFILTNKKYPIHQV